MKDNKKRVADLMRTIGQCKECYVNNVKMITNENKADNPFAERLKTKIRVEDYSQFILDLIRIEEKIREAFK